MNNNPLASITIPTYNNIKTIKDTLKSVFNQSYKNFEVIVIDSNSTDGTLDIIKDFPLVKVYQYEGTLLGARKVGIDKSRGEVVFLIDSDHILSSDSVERAIKKLDMADMVWLYERSYKPKKILEILYDADRVLTQENASDYIEPVGGTILPRVYKKEILSKAVNNIPKKILPLCVAHDHAIIYYESYKLSKRVIGIGSKEKPAIFHQEPWSISNLFKKTYRYGVTTRKLIENKVYQNILKSKNKGRKFSFSNFGLFIKSNILRALRAVPYLYGYYTGKNKKIPGL